MKFIKSKNQLPDQSTKSSRIESIDCLRGLVAVIMVLDHIRSAIHNSSFLPTDLTQTNLPLFMTRWITHFCAPVFVFLAGVSVYLALQRGKTKKDMSKFLLKRGLILIILDIAYVSTLMTGSLGNIHLQVLWVMGISMIVFSGLIWIKDKYILSFALIIVLGHNLLDSIKIENSNGLYFVWSILHSPQLFKLPMDINLYVKYSLIPWIGVMMLGYLFGRIMKIDKDNCSKTLINIGIICTVAFFLVRGINLYGNAKPWSNQQDYVFTVLSFINCQKYPPSLSYLLMTLGPAMLVLGLLEKKVPKLLKPVLVFGREPLRFYVLHMMMIGVFMGLECIVAFILNGGQLPKGDFIHQDIPIVYLGWIFIVIGLYPIFVKGKKKHFKGWKKLYE